MREFLSVTLIAILAFIFWVIASEFFDQMNRIENTVKSIDARLCKLEIDFMNWVNRK